VALSNALDRRAERGDRCHGLVDLFGDRLFSVRRDLSERVFDPRQPAVIGPELPIGKVSECFCLRP